MARTVELTDPRHEPCERPSAFDRWALARIKDERDLPFVRLMGAMTLVLIPFAIALYVPGVFRWWLGAIYIAVMLLGFLDRFILMLHNTSHRTLFGREHRMWNHYIPWVLGPLCGETPETYYVHHMGMHHPENNLPDDLSTTMPYKRDSLLHFLVCFTRFRFRSIIELGLYLLKRGHTRLARRMYVGELGFWAVVAGLMFVSWQATLTVFVIPVLVTRFLMMCGNWAQHAFVCAEQPGNAYRNSIVCINSRYNRRAFNDGYHVGHHVKANRHWTEMPEDFENNLETYEAEETIVFRGIDYFIVWLFLMLKRYDWLAHFFVDIRDEPRTRDEIIALMRSRIGPIREAAGA